MSNINITPSECPECGNKTYENRVDGSCLIARCKSCGVEAVTTYMPDYDDNHYRLYVDLDKTDRKVAILELSKAMKISLLEAKNLFKKGKELITEGDRYDIDAIIDQLSEKIILYSEPPLKEKP